MREAGRREDDVQEMEWPGRGKLEVHALPEEGNSLSSSPLRQPENVTPGLCESLQIFTNFERSFKPRFLYHSPYLKEGGGERGGGGGGGVKRKKRRKKLLKSNVPQSQSCILALGYQFVISSLEERWPSLQLWPSVPGVFLLWSLTIKQPLRSKPQDRCCNRLYSNAKVLWRQVHWIAVTVLKRFRHHSSKIHEVSDSLPWHPTTQLFGFCLDTPWPNWEVSPGVPC